ncbi:exodeoxyribonuclease III [soil metagenome]
MTRFGTWNVNSLKVRQERVEQWLVDVAPDIVCMQETKLADSAFPQLAFQTLGYESAHHGEGRWNGVAVLSRAGLQDVSFGFADDAEPDTEARLMTATCGGIKVVNVYVPNGRALDADHYQYKLAWLDRLSRHLASVASPGDDVIIAGDFNIAPADADVYDPSKFTASTHTSAPERDRMGTLLDWGLIDVFRQHHPDAAKVFSWWDYRAGDFHEGRGMRIDLVLASASVADRAEWMIIDRNARKGKLPSDHAPVLMDLARSEDSAPRSGPGKAGLG